MNYIHFWKFSRTMLNDNNFAQSVFPKMVKNVWNRELKRSYLWKPHEVGFFEQDGDNFVKNLVTVRIQGEMYKIPRIAKRRYLPYLTSPKLPAISLTISQTMR